MQTNYWHNITHFERLVAIPLKQVFIYMNVAFLHGRKKVVQDFTKIWYPNCWSKLLNSQAFHILNNKTRLKIRIRALTTEIITQYLSTDIHR